MGNGLVDHHPVKTAIEDPVSPQEPPAPMLTQATAGPEEPPLRAQPPSQSSQPTSSSSGLRGST